MSHVNFIIEQFKDIKFTAAYLTELFKDNDKGAQERILVGLHRMLLRVFAMPRKIAHLHVIHGGFVVFAVGICIAI